MTQVQDTPERAWLGRRTSTMADLFVAPDSVEQIRALAIQRGCSPVTEMFAQQLLQTPQELRP